MKSWSPAFREHVARQDRARAELRRRQADNERWRRAYEAVQRSQRQRNDREGPDWSVVLVLVLVLIIGTLMALSFARAFAMEAPPARTYVLSATLCATPEHLDCTEASWTVAPAPGASEPFCGGSGAINTIVTLPRDFLPGGRVYLVPETITCRQVAS